MTIMMIIMVAAEAASSSSTPWEMIGTGLGALCFGVYTAWQSHGAKKAAKAAHHQVTVNGGKSTPPTMPDRLSNTETRLTEQIAAVAKSVEKVAESQAKTHDLMVEHLTDHTRSDLTSP